ncbi:xanthine dehydrogenase family protein molybdopterin-binding subunit [Acidaminobacter hydrogenoformans]|nr:molybdopterin cofactor-binding domain-containing protein [Acidaminobacter hydrogenoformans]
MKKTNYNYVGKSVKRQDGLQKASGEMMYTNDKKKSGMLYAALVISEKAHAKVLAIHTEAALQVEGVVKIYTASEVTDQLYSAHIWYPEMKDVEDEALLTNTPKHYGDRIACVVATSENAARRAAGAVKIQYEDLPMVLTLDDALDPSKPSIHPYGNVSPWIEKSFGNTDFELSRAFKIIEDEVETPAQHHGAIENHVCLAYFEDEVLHVETPCQITFQVQMMLAKLTQLPMTRIRVVKNVTGGSFGGKSQPVVEPLCGFIAYDLKQPVLLNLTREQSIVSSRRRNGVRGKVRTAVTETGQILAREIDMLVDTGAYYGNGTAVAMAMAKKSSRLYKMAAQTYKARVAVTNTPVGGAARGYGSPQIHAVTEINIENTARELGLDPLEFRLANLMSSGDVDPLGGPPLGNAQIEACLRQGSEVFGWSEKVKRQPDGGRFKTGVGMAAIVHGNGYFGAFPEYSAMQITLMMDGKILVNSALHDLGCGTVTIIQQIVAEAAGVPLEAVRVLESDTLRSPYEPTGTQACRVTYVCGEAARRSAEMLKEKILSKASVLAEIPSTSLNLIKGIIVNEGGEMVMELGQLTRVLHQKMGESIEVRYVHQAEGNPGSYAVNFAEVVVDTWTGLVDVKKIVSAHDIGQCINPEFVKGQIYGGIQMNLGMALYEKMEITPEGIVKSSNFSKYHVVNAPSMPEIDIVLVEEGEEGGPYGAKSIGESCAVATAPAVINAINHALGTRISKLPATPEIIVSAIQAKE